MGGRPSPEVEKRYRQSPKGKAARVAAQRARRKANTAPSRDYRLSRYGMTEADYQQRLADQGGSCAICFRPEETAQHGRLRVDHDHATGKVRGLLCHHCNVALGHFGDCVPVLENATRYLLAAGAKPNGAPPCA